MIVMVALVGLLGAAALVAMTIGAAGIPLRRVAAAFGLADGDPALMERDRLVLWSIRLPRIAIAIMVGALLAASGAIMQGLFRNPLADPALVGVSGGAALRGRHHRARRPLSWRPQDSASPPNCCRSPPLSARSRPRVALSDRHARGPHLDRHVPAGRPRDRRARQCGPRPAGLPRRRPPVARHHLLDARLAQRRDLGQGRLHRAVPCWRCWSRCRSSPAASTCWCSAKPRPSTCGIAVERLKRACIVLVAAATGAAVSVVGRHRLRRHRRAASAAARDRSRPSRAAAGRPCCSARSLLLVADTFARTLAAPAELPIGIVTAAIGAPFFLFLLLRQRSLLGP